MNKLNTNYVYSLEELTSEELKELINYLKSNYSNWKNFVKIWDNYTLYFNKEDNTWYQGNKSATHNAKELFYTLENVQVDCRELSEEQIKEMADVFEANGYKMINPKNDLTVDNTHNILSCQDGYYIIYTNQNKTTITYEKFMELFAPQYDVTMIVEAPNDFKQITDSIASLLQYKNEKYGNSALEPLNVFQGKCKVGQRLDDKLARVKNNDTLQKNDVADLIGYLFLVCKENEWNNFDEFKD